MKRDLYETLELNVDATLREIKASYRALAKVHHPDKGGDEKKFQEIVIAYEVLSNEERRAAYDRGEDVFNVKDEESVVKQRVMTLFKEAIINANLKETDLFHRVRQRLDTVKRKVKDKNRTYEAAIEESRDIIKRVSGSHSKLFVSLMETDIETYKKGIESNEQELEIVDKCFEFLKDMQYKTDETEHVNYFYTAAETFKVRQGVHE